MAVIKAFMDLNDCVEVKLTSFGINILEEKRKEIASKINMNELYTHLVAHQYKEGDWYRAPLWSLFEDFGPHIHLAAEKPFSEMKIVA